MRIVGVLLAGWIVYAIWRPDLWWVPPVAIVLFFAPWATMHIITAWKRSKTIMTPSEYFLRRRSWQSRVAVFFRLLTSLD